ncbi:hypothetical protein Fcan01_27772 [Folsomia candida]|uniref:Uncharacterized protein n=1 Tax=Folsomia candida TaxID=158441 RepID=A0A226CYJ8_FOLCA|nr:hypothetical protein Fcan01_27772 [Folsomia candida]
MEVEFKPDLELYIQPDDWKAIFNTFLQPGTPLFSTKELELSEKLNLELYPTISDLSKLAKIAYSTFADAKEQLTKCSASPEDIEADLQGIANNQKTPQLNLACSFALQVLEFVKMDTLSDPLQLIITGHSLGGWLAQIATFAVKYLNFDEDKTKFVRAKMEKWHPHCVVFDSPGAFQILDYLNSHEEIRQHHESHTLDICNIVFYPNIVNVINSPFGDMVQISTEQIGQKFKNCRPEDTIRSIYNYTKDFHSIDLFVKVLHPTTPPSPSANDVGLKLDHNLNGEVSYGRIVNWPLVVYSGWDTKVDKRVSEFKIKRMGKLVLKAFTLLRDRGARSEFTNWIQEQTKFCEIKFPQNDEISLSTTRLSKSVKKIIQQFEQIRLWNEYIGKGMKHTDKLKLLDKICFHELKYILEKGFKFTEEDGSIHFANIEQLKILRNCNTFNIQGKLSEGINKLPDHNFTNLLFSSEKYCDAMLAKYPNVEFSLTDIPNLENIGLSESLTKAIVLKYDTSNALYSSQIPVKLHGIDLIIIDCIESNVSNDILEKFSSSHEYRYIWLIYCTEDEPTTPQNSCELITKRKILDTHDLNIDDKLLNSLLEKYIVFQGEGKLLKDIMRNITEEFRDHLRSRPSTILSILNGSQEIGNTPKTLLDLRNACFEVSHKMSSLELETYYQRKTNHNTIVTILSNRQDFVSDKRLSDISGRLSMENIKVKTITDLEEFRNICFHNPACVVDLIRYDEQTFELSLQYNPSFYAEREIQKPGIDLEAVSRQLKSERGIDCYIGSVFPEIINIVEVDPINDRAQLSSIQIPEDIMEFTENENKSIIFVKSYEGYECIKSDRSKIKIANTIIKENDLSSQDVRFIILSDVPGMGKSTTAIRMANGLLKSRTDEAHLLIIIELKTLKNLEQILLTQGNDEFLSSFVNFVATNQRFNEITKFLLYHFIKRDRPNAVTIIADGFDEMTIENKKLFANILMYIRKQTQIRVVITTRPHDCNQLQYALSVLAHTFVPMDNSEPREKENFLVNLWSVAVRCTTKSEIQLKSEIEILDEFATKVIQMAQPALFSEREQFLGVPLQLRILSEIFLPDAMEMIITSKVKQGIIEKFKGKESLAFIYKHYIDRKYFSRRKMGLEIRL